MHKLILLFATAVTIIFATWLTFFDNSRYGTHGDGFTCGEVESTVTYSTATTYYLFSKPLNGQAQQAGTCPYDTFAAKTFALDLWLLAALLGFLTYRGYRPKIQATRQVND